jgi:hypothetical protein
MSTPIKAFAALEKGAPLQPFKFADDRDVPDVARQRGARSPARGQSAVLENDLAKSA